MKKLLLLAFTAVCLQADTLALSDFSNFAPSLLVQPQPVNPADGPWLDSTAQSGPTAYTIGDFGAGAPSGMGGNGFFQYLDVPADWSTFSFLTLTGFAAGTNATPFLSFYMEDADANSSSINVFDLADFTSAGAISLALDWSGLDFTRIATWGFVTNEGEATPFGFTFDHLELSTTLPNPPTVPEAGPGIAGLLATLTLLGVARSRRHA